MQHREIAPEEVVEVDFAIVVGIVIAEKVPSCGSGGARGNSRIDGIVESHAPRKVTNFDYVLARVAVGIVLVVYWPSCLCSDFTWREVVGGITYH